MKFLLFCIKKSLKEIVIFLFIILVVIWGSSLFFMGYVAGIGMIYESGVQNQWWAWLLYAIYVAPIPVWIVAELHSSYKKNGGKI